MGSRRRDRMNLQADLFVPQPSLPDPGPALRARLRPLLQVLLAEAAGLVRAAAAPEADGREDGDDQDHA